MSQNLAEIKENQLRILRSIKGTELNMQIVIMESKMELGQLMALNPGLVLEFEKLADTPVQLKVNDQIFAEGTVVQVGEHYGLEISKIHGGEE